MNAGELVLRAEQVTRRYADASPALDGATLQMRAGTWTALTGRSGAGKTTLLHILAGLDRPDSGRTWMFGRETTDASDDELARTRRTHVGVLHQQFRFIEYLPVWRNVACRLVPDGVGAHERRERAQRALEELGVGPTLDRAPLELSGGEQQRVALARAIVSAPELLFADEPTSNVDSETGAMIVRCLKALQARGATIVVSTHDESLVQPADQLLVLENGRIQT
jgi:putative ABC transport system ATP-binding protein